MQCCGPQSDRAVRRLACRSSVESSGTAYSYPSLPLPLPHLGPRALPAVGGLL